MIAAMATAKIEVVTELGITDIPKLDGIVH